MSGFLVFDSKYGPVLVEADENVVNAVRNERRGAQPLSADDDLLVRAEKKFGDALQTLRTCADNVQDVVGQLKLKPKEVSVEIGLKLEGSAGFVIAKAGAETSMKVTLKWEPSSVTKDSTKK